MPLDRRSRSISSSGSYVIFPEEYKKELEFCVEMFHKNTRESVKNCEMKDIAIVKEVGRGSYGQVLLVIHNTTGLYHAMKVIAKKHLVEKNKISYAKTEKNILLSGRFPFSISMSCFFQDNSYIYFVMPFMSGGDLFTKLSTLGKFTERQSRFCAAQIVLGIEYLHCLGLIYRDLKPENILIDKHGYLKISDFGNSKFVTTRTWTTCGTPEYIAPEVYLHKGYGRAIDWWALGVLIYEMSCGKSPFYANTDNKVCRNILLNQYKYPESFNEDLKYLISNLLQPDLSKRYGNLKNGVNDIKTHNWFKYLDWFALFKRQVEPPFELETHDFTDNLSLAEVADNPKISLIIADKDEFAEQFADF